MAEIYLTTIKNKGLGIKNKDFLLNLQKILLYFSQLIILKCLMINTIKNRDQ